ncbi:hypothetical protein NKG05_02300 [Oerskovia sp. M15]
MATAFADLGSTVTLLSRGRLLGRSEPFAGEAVAAGLRAIGVDVRLGVSVTGATSLPDGGARLAYDGPQERVGCGGAGAGRDGARAADRRPGCRRRRAGTRKALEVDDQLEVQGSTAAGCSPAVT